MQTREEAAIRSKMMGVLLRHARQRANLTLKDVADEIGSSPVAVADHEYGRRQLSLAEIHVFAQLYHVPIAYFWAEELPDENADRHMPVEAVRGLWRRIIGALLRQARLAAGRSHKELATLLDCPTTRIAGYELGDSDVPLPEMETMARFLCVPISYFFDEGIIPAGEHAADMDELARLARLPGDVRRFLLNPGNTLYVRAAMHLSALPPGTLRRLAEGLLEISC